MFLLLKIILFSKKIILLSSPLQALNYKELIFINKDLNRKLLNTPILIYSDNEQDKRYNEINYLLKSFIIKNNVINIRKKLLLNITYVLIQIRKKLCFNYNLIVVGNLFSNINKEFIKISKEAIILDDGTNIFDKSNIIEKKKHNYNFFSIFEKKYFKQNHYKKNNLLFLKKKLDNRIKKTNDVFFIGSPYVRLDYLKEDDYLKLIKKTLESLKLSKIFYIPHPKENTNFLKKIKYINIVNTNYPVEIFFLNYNRYPKLIMALSSSALLTLRIISKKFRLLNIRPKFKSKFFTNSYKKNIQRQNKIKEYMTIKGIKSKNVKI